MKTARDHALSILVIGFIFITFGWYVYTTVDRQFALNIQGHSEFIEVMGREPVRFQGPHDGRFVSGHFQKTLEEAASDRFPLLPYLVGAYRTVQRWFNKTVLDALPSHWVLVKPMGGEILALRNPEMLIQVPRIFSSKNRALLVERAKYYQELADVNPASRLFVIGILAAADWLAHFKDSPGQSSILAGQRYCEIFRTLLGPNIGYTWIGEGFSKEAALALYYRTDHHFSMPGAYQAYLQIINILGRLSPCQSALPIQPRRWFTIPHVAFRGSLARRAGGFLGFADNLKDAAFDLPACTVKISGPRTAERNGKVSYQSGSIRSERFFNHYAEYFGADHGLIEYQCQTPASRNLLVIKDSFSNCMEPLLAAHYRKTFFVDPRHYERDTGEQFDLSRFVLTRGIDDILFLGNQTWVLGLRELKAE